MDPQEKLAESPQSPGPGQHLASKPKPENHRVKVKTPEQHSLSVRTVVLVAIAVAVVAVVAVVVAARRTVVAEAATERMKAAAAAAEAAAERMKAAAAAEAAAEKMKVAAAASGAVVVIVVVALVPRLAKKPLKEEDIMKLLHYIVEEREEGRLEQAMGGMIGGQVRSPSGAAVGWAFWGSFGAWRMSRQSKPIPQAIMGLPTDKKQKLYNEAMAILKPLKWRDTEDLTTLVMGSEDLKKQLMAKLETCLKG
ncbi:uncharacterized protein LOC123930684 isoform X1 [Meles meles]|uniref:uncharacterized protein LOC123930684 isoform X1 n=1 Tax=Meles meles TaxID=9662 RepID=UPI001E6988AB|nr:uncharacterized protein LOC123930684 isoform X1 [Meles meles]